MLNIERITNPVRESTLCIEGWDNERICRVHNYQWLEGEPVCNGVLNNLDDILRIKDWPAKDGE